MHYFYSKYINGENTMNKSTLIFCFFLCIALSSYARHRKQIYVLTDISTVTAVEGEPDDTESLIRLLLYADCFEIKGIGATYSSFKNNIYPQHIHTVINAYEQSVEQLRRFGPYPSGDKLHQLVKSGNPQRGVQHIGERKDTQLSEHLAKTIMENKKTLWILVWGGCLDLAQALWKIEKNLSKEKLRKCMSNLHILAIDDQYDTCGQWIRKRFPELHYITNYCSFRGMYRFGDESLSSKEWVEENIKSIDAPLAILYPVYQGGDPWGNVSGLKEGDTPSFLYLLHKRWGGIFYRIKGTNHYEDGSKKNVRDLAENIAKYRHEFQKDFAERIKRLIICTK